MVVVANQPSRLSADEALQADMLCWGKAHDEQLLYLRSRYYSPDTGRFSKLDPFAGDYNEPQSLHKYAYVHGDPVNAIDPSGEFWNVIIGAVGGAALGALDAYLGNTENPDAGQILQGALFGAVAGAAFSVGLGAAGAIGARTAFGARLLPYAPAFNTALGGVGAAFGFAGAYDSFSKGNYLQGSLRGTLGGLSGLFAARNTFIGALANPSASTSTIWTRMVQQGTEHVGTVIPKWFQLKLPGGKLLHVADNATKHLAELVLRKPGPRAGTDPKNPLVQQLLLEELEGAASQAVKSGIQYGKMVVVGKWELIFSSPRNSGEVGALTHAVRL